MIQSSHLKLKASIRVPLAKDITIDYHWLSGNTETSLSL